MRDREIEIQVKIEHSKPLFSFLSKKAKLISNNRQVDEYFSPAHREFLSTRPIKEWLRLRNAGGSYSLNYKYWHYDKDGKSHYCDEFETRIEDGKKLRKVLNALNFKLTVTVEKIRKLYRYKDYEIAIDRVKGLGDFVEIEYIGKNRNDPAKITDQMINFLKDIGCGKIERNYVGYPFQLLFPNETQFEQQ